jgi:glutamate/tyrosine decarboxylase-like PLP-dependent enzyme
MIDRELMDQAAHEAMAFLESLPHRPVGLPVDQSELLAALGVPLPEEGIDPATVIGELCRTADRGLVATPGPRYFGFVTGGAHPAALAAEWLTAAWDQNAASFVLSPAAAAAEEVVRRWVLDLFGLSPEMSLGITTGGTMANFTGLAAARHALLSSVGWDVERKGLFGAPEIAVLTNDESHVSIFAALQMLGLGRDRVIRIAADEQGRMRPDKLAEALAQTNSPVLVCAQAGNVNTGAFDPIAKIVPLVAEHSGRLHVDGAFGAWAAASPALRHFVDGIQLADSVSVDCHKWLNVPYDSGLILVRDRDAHRRSMELNAAYYVKGEEGARDNHHWVPEASRRARGFAIYVALRALGRRGIAELIERCCALARRMAEELGRDPRVRILNEVCLNQVLVRFLPMDEADIDAFTARVISRIQQDGTCWAGGTTWHGMHALRISVSNWSTTEADIDMSAEAILKAVTAAAAEK